MSKSDIPSWIERLEEEELGFVKRFILSSGSLKEMAKQYEVTYPTVRLRLDRLIEKIEDGDKNAEEPYVTLIKELALNDKIDYNTAKLLVTEFRKSKESE